MQTLLLVRHGNTRWNTKHLIQGKTDIPLSIEGIKESKKLSKIIDTTKIDICLSSPLKRTRETAKIITNGKKKIIYTKDLIERDFGIYEGTKVDNNLIIKLWDYELNYHECNIESIKDCLDRTKNFLDKLKNKYPNKTILIVTHGSFIKALHYNIIGYNNKTDFLSFNPKNATIYKYNIDEYKL